MLKNTQIIPLMEDFKKEAKVLKNKQKFDSLGQAQNLLANQYGYKDYNAIKPILVEKNHIFNKLPKKIKEYNLSNSGLVINSGLWKTKKGYSTCGFHSSNSYILKVEIKKALLFIDKILEKRQTINRQGGTSYGLKHQAEAYIRHYNLFDDYYISNGAFIVALDIRGYLITELYSNHEYSLNIQTNYKKISGDFYQQLNIGKYDDTI